jgi:hypothetical protein
MAQKTEQNRKHDRRAKSERRANSVREKAERTGTSAKQGASRWTSYSSERPLHVAILYAWTQWRHVQTYLARQGFVDVSTTTAKEMDEWLLSFLDPVLHVMVPKFPIATNTRLLTSTKNQRLCKEPFATCHFLSQYQLRTTTIEVTSSLPFCFGEICCTQDVPKVTPFWAFFHAPTLLSISETTVSAK